MITTFNWLILQLICLFYLIFYILCILQWLRIHVHKLILKHGPFIIFLFNLRIFRTILWAMFRLMMLANTFAFNYLQPITTTILRILKLTIAIHTLLVGPKSNPWNTIMTVCPIPNFIAACYLLVFWLPILIIFCVYSTIIISEWFIIT